jgi:hypothetical protein
MVMEVSGIVGAGVPKRYGPVRHATAETDSTAPANFSVSGGGELALECGGVVP